MGTAFPFPPDEDEPVFRESTAPSTAPPAPLAYLLSIVFLAIPLMLCAAGVFVQHAARNFANAASPPPPRAAASRGGSLRIAPFFTAEVRHWEPQILQWAATFQLDPNLIATVMQIESCGDPQAVSSAGARGLFQVMPFHFSPGEDPFDPATNARRGLLYLRQAWQRAGGNPALALAGYNGGLGVIGQPSSLWQAQTRLYVRFGTPIYEDAASGRSHSTALQQWLAARGVSLCRQAHRRLGLP